MRYLHLNHRYWPFAGGSERFMQEISEHFAARGDQVTVITTDAFDLEYFWDAGRKRLDVPGRACHNGVDIHRIPIRHRSSVPESFGVLRRTQGELSRLGRGASAQGRVAEWALSIPDLRSVIWSEGPYDLIHVSNLGLEGMAVAGARMARAMGIPYVITPFTHTGREDDRTAQRFASMPHQTELLRNAAMIFAMTEREADFLRSLDISADISVVGAGVDPAEVDGGNGAGFRQHHGLDGYLVGTLGALASDKGTFDTIAAVEDLRRQGHNVSALFAGPAMSEFERWLESQPRKASDTAIKYLGVIGDEEKRDMLAALDVLVMPSRTESFGIVYLEAWMAGKPVVAADAGAVPEIVGDGENGMLVPFGDASAISAAILMLMSNPARAMKLAENGRAKALLEFTWERVLNRVESGYKTVLGIPGG